MKHLSQFIAIVLFIGMSPALGFVAQFAPHALAQGELPPTIIVNTTLDDLRGCPERCTLRSAIATASPGDVIGFDPVVSGVLVLAQSLVIDKDLTINGPGADVFAIDGSERLRVLEIPAGVTVSISGLTIQNAGDSGIYNAGTLTVTASTFSGNAAGDRGDGGAIYNEGTLTVIDSTFSGNIAGYSGQGGGIYNSVGDLTISNSTFSGNTSGDRGDGGGISNYTGNLVISDSTFSGNSTSGEGGGIHNFDGGLTITGSTFSGNSANTGGGIGMFGGNLAIIGGTFSHNTANFRGGGIHNSEGALTIMESIFSSNSAYGYDDGGGGIYSYGSSVVDLVVTDSLFSSNSAHGHGGGIGSHNGNLTITDSIFSNNSSDRNGGGIHNSYGKLTGSNSIFLNNTADYGGGIMNYAGVLTIANSTLSGNSADSDGGGILNYGVLTIANSTLSGNLAGSGGGIGSHGGSLAITNCTLYGNSANIRGGGVFIGENGAIDLSNSIVAGNAAAEGPDIFGEVNSLSGNLVGDPQGALGLWASDLLEGDLLLGPLADNGGPTQTMALLAGSPAIDAISAEYCVWDDDSDPDTPPVPLLTDQRGAPRTGPCDIGAFEFGAVPPG